MNFQTVTDVQVYPFYPGVATEVAPVVSKGAGKYRSGQVMSNQFHQLSLTDAKIVNPLQIGATYSWFGNNEEGNQVTSHWLFCTALDPYPTFGTIYNWAKPGCIAPLLAGIEEELIKLEALTDCIAVLKSPNPSYGHSQAQLGKSGWLVMTATTIPSCVGILIDDPALPIGFAEGTRGITITAKSTRTLQSISLDSLYCARAGTSALFLNQLVLC